MSNFWKFINEIFLLKNKFTNSSIALTITVSNNEFFSGINFKILSSTIIFIFIFLGSLFGQGNGTTLAVIIFFITGLLVARKTKNYFINSNFYNYF